MATFPYQNLEIWHEAVDLADRVIEVVESLDSPRVHYRLREQIEAAACSVPANIAEGKGRKGAAEFAKFLGYSRGSLYETLTFLEIFARCGWITTEAKTELENDAARLSRKLNALLASLDRKR